MALDQVGIETVQATLQARPQLKIVAISAQFTAPLLLLAELVHAQASLSKPIHADELLEVVARLLVG